MFSEGFELNIFRQMPVKRVISSSCLDCRKVAFPVGSHKLSALGELVPRA